MTQIITPSIITPSNASKIIIPASEYSGNLTVEMMEKGKEFKLASLYADGAGYREGSTSDYHKEWLDPIPGTSDKYAVNLDAYWEAVKTFFWFFAQEFVEIKSKGSKMVPFVLNRPQQYVERVILEENIRRGRAHLWVLKPRQIGMSLYFANRALWSALFYDMDTAIFAAKKDEQARQLIFPYAYWTLKRLQSLAKRGKFPYPELLELQIDKPSGGELAFADVIINGENISGRGSITIKQAEKSAVGFTCPYAHVTEASRVRDFAAFSDALDPAIPPEPYPSYYFVESTAYHAGQFFFDEWERLTIQYDRWLQGTGDYPEFRAVFIPSFMHHEYRVPDYVVKTYNWDRFWNEADPELYGEDEESLVQMDWYDPLDKTTEKLGLDWWLWRRRTISRQKIPPGTPFTKRQVFDQNFPMRPEDARLHIGHEALPRDIVLRRKSMCVDAPWKGEIYLDPGDESAPVFEEKTRGRFLIWDRPRHLKVYILGVDLAGGVFGDYHVGHIWYPGAKLLAASYRSNDESREDFLVKMMAFGRYFNNALMAVEVNYYGKEVQMILTDRGRHHYPGAPYPNIYKRAASEDIPYDQPSSSIGIHSSATSKNYGHSLLLQRFRDFDRFDRHGQRIYCGTHILYDEVFREALTWERRVSADGEFKDTTPHHIKGAHDDTLSALICCLVGEEFLFGKYEDDIDAAGRIAKAENNNSWMQDFVNKHKVSMPVADITQTEIEELLDLNFAGRRDDFDEPMFNHFD